MRPRRHERACRRPAGADLETTQRQVNLDRFKEIFAGDDERKRRAFETGFQRPAVEAAFKEIRGDTARTGTLQR